MDAMALEDNTEAAVSADANDAESDKVIEQFLTGDFYSFHIWRITRKIAHPMGWRVWRQLFSEANRRSHACILSEKHGVGSI